MSLMDYGCNYRIDNEMYEFDWDWNIPDWVPEFAYYKGNKYTIRGNYFCYLGDKDFFLCFYKTYFLIVNGTKIIDAVGLNFKSEHLLMDGIDIFVSHLSDRVKVNFDLEGIDEDWFPNRLAWLRYHKSKHRYKKTAFSDRYIAEWNYNGHHYSVLYGYGIDTFNEMNRLYKNGQYNFTDDDMKHIEEWKNLCIE